MTTKRATTRRNFLASTAGFAGLATALGTIAAAATRVVAPRPPGSTAPPVVRAFV